MALYETISISTAIFALRGLLLFSTGIYSFAFPSEPLASQKPFLRGTSQGVERANGSVKFHSSYHSFKPALHDILSESTYRTSSLTILRLTTTTVGALCLFAAAQQNFALMSITLSLGLLAAFVFAFTGGLWRKVAIFEGVMGIITGLGLLIDYQARLRKN